ncbi:MAG: hypothetical protein ACSHXK_10335 [Oceanococcus sp.]
MTTGLLLQSCPAHEAQGWLQLCMDNARCWAEARGLDYRFIDDELFSVLPEDLRPGSRISAVVASDLARLRWLQDLLREGYQQVLWLDADFLIFHPQALNLPDADYAVGREVWVQADGHGKWKAWKKVHNAALMFRNQGDGHNSFLDFYADTAQRMLQTNTQGMPAQFIGPKLLTALHNVVQLPVMEDMGMLSPAVVEDLLGANNGALACMHKRSTKDLAGANLCRSSVSGGELENADMHALVERLLQQGLA